MNGSMTFKWILILISVCFGAAFFRKPMTSSRMKVRPILTSYHPSIFDYKAFPLGETSEVSLRKYYGKKCYLIVNIATHHKLAKQHFTELRELYDNYSPHGLEILAFPCDEFTIESMSSPELYKSVILPWGFKFPVFSKIYIKKPLQHPLYEFLCRTFNNGQEGSNSYEDFMMFMCNSEGVVLRRHDHYVSPMMLDKEMKKFFNITVDPIWY